MIKRPPKMLPNKLTLECHIERKFAAQNNTGQLCQLKLNVS